MQKFHRGITLERLDKFTDQNYFSDVNLCSLLVKAKSEESIQLLAYSVPDLKRIPFDKALSKKSHFKPAKKGDSFGPSWSTVWFHVTLTIPKNFAGERVDFVFDCDNEVMVWSTEGKPLQGMTGGGGFNRRVNYPLSFRAAGGEKFEFYLEMANNGMFGVGLGNDINPPQTDRFFTLKSVELNVINEQAHKLFRDFEIIRGIAKELPEQSQEGNDALVCANSIVNAFMRDQASIEECLKISGKFLAQKGNSTHSITAISMCHIDSAWLWPVAETIRKCARSWSTQIGFMKRYPEFKFACSQAQQFEWVEEHYPLLFEELKKYVKTGQFIPIGGTWVEMDCNVPSGESLVRQFLYGQRYYKKHFGVLPIVFWLPDTFGYSAQLPQIVRLSGMKYFLTQKLSWNNINKFPNNTFYWVGLDGSKVLTHFPPADSYTSQAEVREFVHCVKNNKDKCYSNESLFLFGNGDGGGGPTEAMIERVSRLKDVQGLAKIDYGHPDDFFNRLETNSGKNGSGGLTEWKGELYFELHRGTYTSQALNKRYNRKLEVLLREIEILLASSNTFEKYPKEELDHLWKLFLLNQFHDILPGSSIEQVYKDSTADYKMIEEKGKDLMEKAFEQVLSKSFVNNKSSKPDPVYLAEESIELFDVCCFGYYGTLMKNALNRFKKADLVLSTFNSLGFARKEVIEVDLPEGVKANELGFSQVTAEGNKGLVIVETKPLSVQVHQLKKENIVPAEVSVSDGLFTLENYYVRAVFTEQGQLKSFYDKINSRQVIAEGSLGNTFRIFDDVPLFWDAWDVEVYHLEKSFGVGVGKVSVYEKGPVRVSLLLEVNLSPTSKLRQVISLSSISPRLDFTTSVDWNENRKFLKVEFPFNIQSDYATYETAFGWVQRPTHYNTSWDLAKFEVCGHKFADLSEYGYGVALLNDCKYGYATHGNVMRLSLLRAPKAPDANCDIGKFFSLILMLIL